MVIKDTQKLSWFLSEKNQILVINFSGALIRANLPRLEECVNEVVSRKFKYLVLSFQDVTAMDITVVPEIARIQKLIRERPATLRTCSLKPEQKALLNDRGLLRPGEFYDSIVDAVKSLLNAAPAQPASKTA